MTVPPVPATALGPIDRLKIQGWRAAMAGFQLYLDRGYSLPAGITEHRYGPIADERLDLIAADPAVEAKLPLLFVHGGGWVSGRKEAHTHALARLARRGHAIYNVEYPLAPEHPHPQPLLSLLGALRWIRDEHGVERVHLMGDSAGGNLVMMLAILTGNPEIVPRVLPRTIEGMPEIASVITLYAVLDRFIWVEAGFPGALLFLRAYGGPTALDRDVLPANALTPLDIPLPERLPPAFIAAAGKDPLAPSSKLAFDHLRARFDHVHHKVYPESGHGFYMQQSGDSDGFQRDLEAFLDRVGRLR